jgi:hypothetical protein
VARLQLALGNTPDTDARFGAKQQLLRAGRLRRRTPERINAR